jgi:hypothetical protein
MAVLDNTIDIKPLEELMIHDGKIVPVPFSMIKNIPQEAISLFCHKHALYQFPTTELIDFLKNEIGGEHAIEIGAGNGCIGRSVGIIMTDNWMQTWDDIKKVYFISGQPTITYGKDVEDIPALDAIERFKPKVVVSCWVTHKWHEGMSTGNMYGVEEEKMFDLGVKKYIHVGNVNPTTGHTFKPILDKYKVEKLQFPWLVSRSMQRDLNTIYIFNGEKL